MMLKKPQNLFILIFVIFAVWMLFFDANSWLIHRELNHELEDLETERAYYQREIEKDNKAIKELKSEKGTERVAREKYYMKKENEDIYIIEYEDSLKKEQN